MKKIDKILAYQSIAILHESALSSIAGMATACLNEDEISDWQAKGILRCIVATALDCTKSVNAELNKIDD